MAAYVQGDHPVLGGEGRDLGVPDPVVDVTGVEEDHQVPRTGVEVGEVAVGGREGAQFRSNCHDNQGVIFWRL